MTNRLRPNAAGWLWAGLCAVWALTFIYGETPLDETIWCIWRRFSGLACAGCGLTRSFCAMSTGEPVFAFFLHPAGPFLYVAMVTHIGLAATRWLTGHRDRWQMHPRLLWIFWIMVAVIFGLHLLRTMLSWV